MPFIDAQLHQNQALTDYALAFRQDLLGYLWSRLLPPKPVAKRSDYIRVIDKGQLLRKYDLRVGASGRLTEVQFKIGANQQFNAADYAVEATMRASEVSNADAILEYEQELIYHAMVAMHTNIEVITIKETLRNPSVITNNLDFASAPALQWDEFNSSSSSPIQNIKQRVLRVKSRTGHAPTICLMHDMVWDVVQRHPDTLARGGVHPTGNAIVTKEQFEKICDLPPGSLITTSMTYNIATEGSADPDFRSFIGPDVLIAYVAPAATRSYSLGQSFQFLGEKDADIASKTGIDGLDGGGVPFLVLQFPDHNRDPRGANVLRIVGGLDQKILNADAAELMLNVVDKTDTDSYQNFLNN